MLPDRMTGMGSQHSAVGTVSVNAPVDVIVAGGDVVTMNTRRDVFAEGAVAIAGNRIAEVGRRSEVCARHPDAVIFDAAGTVVTPGLVNAHQHLTGDPLVRSCIPDLLRPGASIFEWSVPLHGAHTDHDDEVSASLSALESLRYGVTTLIEAGTVAHPHDVARAMDRLGVRGTIGTWGWDVDDVPYAAPCDEVLDRQRHVVETYPAGGRVEGWVTLVGHNLASDALLAGAADLARKLDTGMTMHISPTSSDPDEYLARTGKRPLLHLHDLDVLGPHLLLAHAVWLDDAEIEVLLDTDTSIAYCPWAYMRLGQGVARHGRHADIVERGGRVALGCDASNAGDLADILRAAALAAALARDTRIDPTRFGADTAFELATIAGAAAVGMSDRIGSLEPGKLADLVIHDTRNITWTPRGDLALHLVWGTDGRTVRDVIVDGEIVLRDGHSTRVDEDALFAEARRSQTALLDRAGITVPDRWPVIS
jgi:5-methylthioadenosine/S-adenosylhomocysteine deaminase